MLRILGRVYVALACATLAVVLALAGVDEAVGPPKTSENAPDIASIPYYAAQPWTARWVGDRLGAVGAAYEPFTVWKKQPYASETVNVGPDRLRVVPGTDCSPGTRNVWFFGGSTMWGVTSPDWATIPALFLAELHRRDSNPLCVRNFGEPAWNSTQEVIALVKALQHGWRPAVVFFYDGANDLGGTFSLGNSFGHARLASIASLFDHDGRGRGVRRSRERSPRELLRWFAPNLATRLDLVWPIGSLGAGTPRRKASELAEEAVRVLRVNREIVRGLADRFGFEAHFFWQPMLLSGGKHLAPAEQEMVVVEKATRPTFLDVVRRANELVVREARPDETDLSGVFENVTAQLYTDPVHVTPQGNELIARAMVEVYLAGSSRREGP